MIANNKTVAKNKGEGGHAPPAPPSPLKSASGMYNKIKDLNLVLNHDPSHYFNIKMTTIDAVGTLCISSLGIYILNVKSSKKGSR